MARDLNRLRMLNSWIIAAISLAVIVFTKAAFAAASLGHDIITTIGLVLVAACALGRVYATAFLGGLKNKQLVDYGPFSVVRNPLYVFSLLGVLGLSLVSLRWEVILFAPVAFTVLYYFLIRREEKFLKRAFGEAYTAYAKRVPRLVPNFKLYSCPETVEMRPKLLKNAALDAIWWLIAFWAIVILERFI